MAVHDDGRGESLFVIGGGMDAWGAPVARNVLQWVGTRGQCRPDCDNSGSVNVADFTCFLRKYASLDPYTDGNVDGVLDVGEFTRFVQQFAAGCP